MKISHLMFIPLLGLLLCSCLSTKSTLKNIDDTAPEPVLIADDFFEILTYSTNKKYGTHPDYPINVFYKSTQRDSLNVVQFINGLTGPNGETLTYKKKESCCPFPTKRSPIGAGFLEVYDLWWNEKMKPITLYFNYYEKGLLAIPVGFSSRAKANRPENKD
jgi:hypothetical protein